MRSIAVAILCLLTFAVLPAAANNPAEESWQALAISYANACTGFQVQSSSWLESNSCAKQVPQEVLEKEVIASLAVESQQISWSEMYSDLSYLHVDDSAICSLYKTQFEISFRIQGLTGISPLGKAVSVNYWSLMDGSQSSKRCLRLILTY